jgi:hypothetical protein
VSASASITSLQRSAGQCFHERAADGVTTITGRRPGPEVCRQPVDRLAGRARPPRPRSRALSDEQLALAAPVSLYAGAPLTCQFFPEDHAVRHSYHHLARIRAALKR